MRRAAIRLVALSCLAPLLCTAGCATPPGAVERGIVTEGLVAHYAFDEGSGGVLHDVTGRGNDGKIHGATFVKLNKGYALKFDGIDDCVDCGNTDDLNPAYEVTIEAWLWPDGAVAEEGDFGVVGKTPWWFGLSHDSRDDGLCRWYISGGDNSLNASVAPDTWHHAAGTFDGTTMCLYLEGRRIKTDTSNYEMIAEGEKFYIARSGEDPSSPYGGYFKGLIGQVRVYDRALNEEEVRRNFHATRQRFEGFKLSAAEGPK